MLHITNHDSRLRFLISSFDFITNLFEWTWAVCYIFYKRSHIDISLIIVGSKPAHNIHAIILHKPNQQPMKIFVNINIERNNIICIICCVCLFGHCYDFFFFYLQRTLLIYFISYIINSNLHSYKIHPILICYYRYVNYKIIPILLIKYGVYQKWNEMTKKKKNNMKKEISGVWMNDFCRHAVRLFWMTIDSNDCGWYALEMSQTFGVRKPKCIFEWDRNEKVHEN